MALLKLLPSFKDYLWGGRRLAEEYNKEYDGGILAESWELSCHPDGPSTIGNGVYAGTTLQEYIRMEGKEVLGSHCRRFKDFPILIKLIDAKDNLSVQVHPNNTYALKHEGQYGKTEMWYVMDCEEGAVLYYGFQREINREEFARRIRENTLLEVLNAVSVQKGDVLFIEAGTIHAIGKGIVIAEIQQNSNVTYRVYDYGRVGADGKRRDLHIEKALAVTSCVPIIRSKNSTPHIASCDYFTVDKLNLDGHVMKQMSGCIDHTSFASILILEGQGQITCEGETLSYQKGDSFFLSAGSGAYQISGSCQALVTTIGEKASPVRIGIDMGGVTARIGLVDVNQKLLAWKSIPMDSSSSWRNVIREIGKEALALLEENQIPLDKCVGAGLGAPGTIDQKNGIITYSNHTGWEQVPVVRELGAYLPIPMYLANDADCAALGEAAGGAARDYQDVIMITLGTGVGGGIILNGEIYQGRLSGGSELGHCVIVEDGELCTCGRRGCLEAYVSADAIVRDGRRVMRQNPKSLLWMLCGGNEDQLTPELVFEAFQKGDPSAETVVANYKKKLLTGIINLVNLFRPQAVLLGGRLSVFCRAFLPEWNQELARKSFGGQRSQVPVIELASLGSQAVLIGAANLC